MTISTTPKFNRSSLSGRETPLAIWFKDGFVAATLITALVVVSMLEPVGSLVPDPPPPPPYVDLAELPEPTPPPLPQFELSDLDNLQMAAAPPLPAIDSPKDLLAPVDATPRLLLGFTANGKWGVKTTTGNPDDRADDNKRLTYSVDGSTNNTRVFVDGATPEFGGMIGKLLRKREPTSEGGFLFEWEYQGVRVTQTVTPVSGAVSRRMDCVQVDYLLQNAGVSERHVGLRTMVDSLIGSNDGVPFIVPGQEQIVTSPQRYTGVSVPEFVRALERPNLLTPGVIVDLNLRPSTGEHPDEVYLTHWPGGDADWLYDRTRPLGRDSAIGLYYAPQTLEAGGERLLSFTYGLGAITSTESGNSKLALTAGGPFHSGERFWLVALVADPQDGEAVTVELPDGLTLDDEHPATKHVRPQEGQEFAQISWLVQTDRSRLGQAVLRAKLTPSDVSEEFELVIQPRGTRLTVISQESVYAGAPFFVLAAAQDLKGKQQVQINLPEGMTLGDSESAVKLLPPSAEGEDFSQVHWLVKPASTVLGHSEISVRLMPDGTESKKRIDVQPPQPRLTLAAPGTHHAGRSFWISAILQNTAPGGTVELELPDSLVLSEQESAKKYFPPAAAGKEYSQVRWLVNANRLGLGKVELSAQHSAPFLKDRFEIELLPPTPRLILLCPQAVVSSGHAFWLVALVEDSSGEQSVEISLPTGWTFAKDHPGTKPVPKLRNDGYSRIDWLIEADKEGKFSVQARLLPDQQQQEVMIEVGKGNLIN